MKRFSKVLALTIVFVMMMSSMAMAAPGKIISNVLEAEFEVEELAGEFGNNTVSTKKHGDVDGYIVDVRLIEGTFENAKVVVSLVDESGNIMQKNTLIENHNIIGTKLTVPFDVKGTFDYNADKFWIVEGSVKGNYEVPAKVVIEVTLANGKKLTDELTDITPVEKHRVINETQQKGYDTIQEAIEEANPGDKIKVGEGEFKEEIRIEKPIHLIGAGIDKTILSAKDENSSHIIWLGDARNYGNDLSGTIIEDFTINSPIKAVKDVSSIYLTGKGTEGNKIIIRNNKFLGQEGENNQGIAVLTPYSPEIKDVKIVNNEIYDMKYGMYFNSISNIEVADNTIDETRYAGIIFFGKSEYPCSNIVVTNNTLTNIASGEDGFHDIYYAGIGFYYYGDNITVEDNNISMLNDRPEVYFRELINLTWTVDGTEVDNEGATVHVNSPFNIEVKATLNGDESIENVSYILEITEPEGGNIEKIKVGDKVLEKDDGYWLYAVDIIKNNDTVTFTVDAESGDYNIRIYVVK